MKNNIDGCENEIKICWKEIRWENPFITSNSLWFLWRKIIAPLFMAHIFIINHLYKSNWFTICSCIQTWSSVFVLIYLFFLLSSDRRLWDKRSRDFGKFIDSLSLWGRGGSFEVILFRSCLIQKPRNGLLVLPDATIKNFQNWHRIVPGSWNLG